ncbi:hypothetical protein BRARA_I00468 [Brassica rapa]|uniref:Single-stranded DNA binding protein Ssb-like OB fold domain-containing protein n=2 Tax=Brassica TaxID=3705 RepID=M4F6B8_BRACM|nr:uncharacterized protein At4g28440-like [Brassica rapa]XP_048595334.1 uncharacterized protein At4g28440-like [Brassica napus]RID43618.1 hypothetical protein BRARA_I00468 [Brassica rapa]CAF2036134.1 unnamed protein product [Brassica napus]CDY19723.1 BnaA09g03760D [Brassica napus]
MASNTSRNSKQRNGPPPGRKKKHKVNQLKPGTSGHTLTFKVVDQYSVTSFIRPGRIAECLVGDETASIIFTARNDQVDLMKPGTTVNLRNTKINMFHGFMGLAVNKFGRIEVVTEPADDITVKEDNNLSLVEYEPVYL